LLFKNQAIFLLLGLEFFKFVQVELVVGFHGLEDVRHLVKVEEDEHEGGGGEGKVEDGNPNHVVPGVVIRRVTH
jgi:hypothetical protein